MDEVKRQIKGWDLTIPNKDKNYSQQFVKDFLNKWADKWVFQEEPYQEGGTHYQCRFFLKVKRTGSALKGALIAENELFGDWSPTTKDVHLNNNFNYVMKPERVAGPWTNKDKEETWQLKEFMEKGIHYPYHQQILEMLNKKDWRNVDLIYCPKGSKSKTIFCEYLEYNNLAVDIPPLRNMEDIMAWGLCEIKNSQGVDWYNNPKAFVIDMPRGMKKDKLGEFYAGIETMKDGRFYDKRYEAQKCRIGRPRVFIFSNALPKFDLLSRDRWNVWLLDDDLKLNKYDIEAISPPIAPLLPPLGGTPSPPHSVAVPGELLISNDEYFKEKDKIEKLQEQYLESYNKSLKV